MKILHYSLGFPPFRSGGMTKYCIDLMIEQKESGNEVGLLWPGAYYFNKTKTKIKNKRKYRLNPNVEVDSFELIDALPVPLLNGIKDTKSYLKSIDKKIFAGFFSRNKIEIFHVHTLMGLPIECIEAAKEAGVKTFFTSHDYFGICFKWGLFNNSQICTDKDCQQCVECNKTALDLKKISILQSPLYRYLKNNPIVKKLRDRNNKKLYLFDNANIITSETPLNNEHQRISYCKLRMYYIHELEIFDTIIFNSNNTRDIFRQYVNVINSEVISVSHRNIKDCRKQKKCHNELNIGYLGPITIHKGYFFIKKVLDSLNNYSNKFNLHVFAPVPQKANYEIVHEPYGYEELDSIMDQIDVLVMPSQWNETFGFTVLEALSYGVPVIVSEHVGAKDLVVNGKYGFVLQNDDAIWKRCILHLLRNREEVEKMNKDILNHFKVIEFKEHSEIISNIYKGKLYGKSN
ncbi:MAG: glycosyltransferase [Erysipelotrichaceae bacterium]|nr:glycosyltransferase [Erysipelotrichaceae bacterium]